MTPHLPRVGGHYFPLCLANGSDAVLIDWSGSIASGTRSLRDLPLFWYKHNRRCARLDVLFPMLRTGYILHAAGSEVPRRGSVQRFDPVTGILTTRLQGGGLDLRIETYLSDDHALVEAYTVRRVPRGQRADIEFFLLTPDCMPLQHLPVSCLPAAVLESYAAGGDLSRRRELVYTCAAGKRGELLCRFSLPARFGCAVPLAGTAVLACDHPRTAVECATPRARADTLGSLGDSRLWVRDLRVGDHFTRRTVVVDEWDAPAGHERVARRLARLSSVALRRAHVAVGKDFFAASSLRLPDPQLNRLYAVGRRHLRGAIVRDSGMLTLGPLPWHWGGWRHNPWDAWFSFHALLGANHLAEARHTLDFYLRALPEMRRRAAAAGVPEGAKFPWGTVDDETLRTYDADEVHHHGVIVDQVFAYWQSTGDRAFLRQFLPLLRALARYMADALVRHDGRHHFLRPVIGVAERADLAAAGWVNETFTVATICSGLRQTLAACEALGEEERERARYTAIADDFYAILRANYHRGVLCHYPPAQGPAARDFSPIAVFNLFPELPAAASVAHFTRAGSVWTPRCNPWAAARAAQALARVGDARAWQQLARVPAGANQFGGLVEHVQVDGAPHLEWYTTPHGAFIHAVQLCLAHEQGDLLRLLPAPPPGRVSYSCRRLRTRSGLLVSIEVRDGCAVRASITNAAAAARTFRLALHPRLFAAGMADRPAVTLRPRETLRLLPRGGGVRSPAV